MYCAIIGDMVDSQKIPPAERDVVQRKLEHVLNGINKQFSTHISANFYVTLGDEFQGLLNESAYCLPVIRQLIKDMYPRKIRFGIGVGDINTKIDPEKAIGADGSAYHFARNALSILKKNELPTENLTSNTSLSFLVRFETGAADTTLLNLICSFIQGIISKWSEKQWETVKALMENDYRQNNAADHLGRTRSTISRNLRAARYEEYETALEKLSDYLRDTYDNTVTASVRLQQAENLISSAEYLTNVQINYVLALAKHQEALSLRETVLKSPDERIAESLDYVGLLHLKKGNAQAALAQFKKALAMRKKLDSEGSREKLAKSNQNIGDAFLSMGKYQDAFSWYQKALHIQEKILSEEHPDTAVTYSSIAKIHYYLGDYAKELEWYQKALGIREKALGKEHPDTATTYNNIAVVYLNQGDYAKALEWLQKALGIREKALGKEHPDTAATYDNIALVYGSQGDYTKALEWYQKALGIREKALGKEHPDTARSYGNIAMVYYSQGDYAKALEWLQKALGICEKALGKEHPDTATTYNNIAVVYGSQGDYAKALEWYKKALAILEKMFGERSPKVLPVYHNLSRTYNKLGKHEEEEKWWKKANINLTKI